MRDDRVVDDLDGAACPRRDANGQRGVVASLHRPRERDSSDGRQSRPYEDEGDNRDGDDSSASQTAKVSPLAQAQSLARQHRREDAEYGSRKESRRVSGRFRGLGRERCKP